MNKTVVVYGSAVVGAVVIAVLAWWLYSPENNANFPEGTDWLCTSPACATAFKLTIKELADYSKESPGVPIKCPKCSTLSIRAEKCLHCGKAFPMPRDMMRRCPHCGKDNSPPQTG